MPFHAISPISHSILEAEELVFALITMCPVGIPLRLGFGKGPGGTESGARAALMGLSFHQSQEKHIGKDGCVSCGYYY